MRISMFVVVVLVATGVAIAGGSAAMKSVAAEDPLSEDLVVVELFTSQGCSSCPPADRLLSELADEPDIVALSFHVDYWNRLGWTDPFSSPQWSARQERYARQQASDSVYTPQMVIDGQFGFVGSDEREARRLLEKQRERGSKPVALQLEVSWRDDSVSARISPKEAGSAEHSVADLLMVIAEESVSTSVRRGENRGRELRHRNVVRALKRVRWLGETVEVEFHFDESWSDDLRLVAMVQQRDDLRVLGAAATR